MSVPTVFRNYKGKCERDLEATIRWIQDECVWADHALHGVVRSLGYALKMRDFQHTVIVRSESACRPFDDADAALLYLDLGGELFKLPRSVTEGRVGDRYYILEDMREIEFAILHEDYTWSTVKETVPVPLADSDEKSVDWFTEVHLSKEIFYRKSIMAAVYSRPLQED
jgi:hypothetical protein